VLLLKATMAGIAVVVHVLVMKLLMVVVMMVVAVPMVL